MKQNITAARIHVHLKVDDARSQASEDIPAAGISSARAMGQQGHSTFMDDPAEHSFFVPCLNIISTPTTFLCGTFN